MTRCEIVVGNALDVLRGMESNSIQACVTSPPYWRLRDYGVAEQLGLEATPQEYVERMVEVFGEVRRVLRKNGTLWLNLGDSYATYSVIQRFRHGLKPKDLVGIPWRVSFALQSAGWWLRSDIIWSKTNPMPESIIDRPTKSHEYLFLLTKSARYYYDAQAIADPASHPGRVFEYDGTKKNSRAGDKVNDRRTTIGNGAPRTIVVGDTRNARSVWTIPTSPFHEAHFATFPPELPRRCILAGSRPGDTILDPFAGAGTTGLVAHRLGRDFVGIELNPKYAEMARRRIRSDAPLLVEGGA